jgi:hypothetical protein
MDDIELPNTPRASRSRRLESVREPFDFLRGESVEQIWVWGPIRLVLSLGERPEPGVYVDLHRGSFIEPGGRAVEFDASVIPGSAAPVLDVLRQRIVDVSASEGVLTLRFESGAELRALPDATYESWTVVGEGGRVFQCMPGGEVDSW